MLLTSVFSSQLYSQTINLGFKTGVGTYFMKELKALNKTISTPFQSELVSDFPPYFFYQPYLIVKMRIFSIGLNYTYQSTGSRISAKDYSGEFRYDMQVHSHNLGINNSLQIIALDKNSLYLYTLVGIEFSGLTISHYLNVLNAQLTDESIKYKALNYYIEPGFTYQYQIIPAIGATLHLGYCLQLGDKPFHKSGDKDQVLTNPYTGDHIKPEWDGFRFGISVIYTLPHKNSSLLQLDNLGRATLVD